jgi:hypothetical protein
MLHHKQFNLSIHCTQLNPKNSVSFSIFLFLLFFFFLVPCSLSVLLSIPSLSCFFSVVEMSCLVSNKYLKIQHMRIEKYESYVQSSPYIVVVFAKWLIIEIPLLYHVCFLILVSSFRLFVFSADTIRSTTIKQHLCHYI